MPDRDRLSALDAAFLDLDTAAAPLHVGWTMRVEGPPPRLAALRRHLDARLDRVPRFRCRIATLPLSGGERVWADDPGFDIARHVHAVTLPAPGGTAELRALAGTMLSAPLDRERPLWRLALVDGLAGGGFAIVGQAHHALVDGMAALQVAALLFDAEPAPPPDPVGAPWRPARAPAVGAPAARVAAGSVRRAAHAAAQLARATRDGGQTVAAGLPRVAGDPRSARLPRPDGLRDALRDATDGLDTLMRPAPRTALDRTATARRSVAFAEVGLEALREAGRRHGGTVNDALLAACSLALGRALRRRGERPERLKAMIPVDVRDPDQELGNAISFVFADLPVRETEPARALAAVRKQTALAKAAGHARPLAALARSADVLPVAGRRAVARLAARAAEFNVVISNVPGPEAPLYLLGRRVQTIFPAVPFLDGHALSIGALSYDGRVGIALYADAEVVPDAVDIARDVEAALDALRVEPQAPRPADRAARAPGTADLPDRAAPTPWRRRARERRLAQRAARR